MRNAPGLVAMELKRGTWNVTGGKLLLFGTILLLLGSGAILFGDEGAMLPGQPTTAPVANVGAIPTTGPAAIGDAVDFKTTAWVSVHLHDAPADVAAAAVAGQAGVPTLLHLSWDRRKPLPMADFEIENEPFSLALMKLCDTYGLAEAGPRRDEGWTLISRAALVASGAASQGQSASWAGAPASVDGPFVVLAIYAMHTRSVDPIAVHDPLFEPDDSFQVGLVILAEPRVSVLARPVSPVFEKFVDGRGTSLAAAVTGDAVAPSVRAAGSEPWILVCPMQPRDPAATRIATLSGHVRLKVVTRSLNVEIPNPGVGKQATVDLAGLRAVVQGFVNKPGRGDEAVVTVYRDDVNAKEWGRRIALLRDGSQVRAFNAQGTLLQQFSRTQVDGAESVTIRLDYGRVAGPNSRPVGGPPARLAWAVPVEAGEAAVPFSFRDLALPAE